MAGATTSMTIRMDRNIKEQSQKLFKSLGMDMTTAINIFLRQSLLHNGLPFDVNLNANNHELLLAKIAEADADPDIHGPFKTTKEMMEDLNADD